MIRKSLVFDSHMDGW